jgi:hypothetical protein
VQDSTPAGNLPQPALSVGRELLEELQRLRRERRLGHVHGISIEMRHACEAVNQLERALESGRVSQDLIAGVRDCLGRLPLSRPYAAYDLLDRLQAQLTA